MPLPSLKRLSFSAPPPKIALLPDSMFFVRPIPVDVAATPEDVSSRVELALEGLAPFPLAQMYYGHHWRAGAKHALVFAAYRKRFTADQIEVWHEAEGVIPAFATLLGTPIEGATTFLLTTEEGLTAIHWSDPTDVPNVVLTRNWHADASDADRAKIREDLLRELGGSRAVVDVQAIPIVAPDSSGGETTFQSGAHTSTYSREELDGLDIRDKDDLAARRRARARDLLLWRVFIGSAAALALALVLEVSIFGVGVWQKRRLALKNRQDTPVTEILTKENVAMRIEELSTKRLLPFEMITEIQGKMPPSVNFVAATAKEIGKLELDGVAATVTDALPFQNTLKSDPILEKIDASGQTRANGKYEFHWIVTFKPGTLAPGS